MVSSSRGGMPERDGRREWKNGRDERDEPEEEVELRADEWRVGESEGGRSKESL